MSKFIRLTLLLSILLGVFGLGTTSAQDVPREKTLIIGFEGEPVPNPELANPYVSGSRINQGYHQLMIESLYYLNYQTGEAIPWLAAGPEEFNDDYTEITVPLREGVKWADGESFTADDVVFTINMLKENPLLSYAAGMERWVAEIEAVDELTVKFTLTESNPRFIYNNFTVRIWGAVRIVPQHIWEGQDPNTFTNFDSEQGWPVWTGPYKLVQASPTEFVYDRRDDWWAAEIGFKELPAPERVVFVEAGPDERKAATLAANEVDGQPSLLVDTFMDVKARNPHAIGWTEDPPHAWTDPCPAVMGFNAEVPPWDDPNMRWAVAYALDHQKIADASTAGFGVPAPYNFPDYPALWGWLEENWEMVEEYDPTVFDPDKAMELIEGAGYEMGDDGFYHKDGERLTVDITVKSENEVLPPLIVSMLQKVGIDAAPKALASASYYDALNRKQYDIETTHVACGSVVEPFGELNNLHSQWITPIGELHNGNRWQWANEEYDQIVDQIANLPPNADEERDLFRQALEIRLKELPILSLNQQYRVVPYSTRYWTNWPTADNDYFHPPNWWMCFLMVVLEIEPAPAE